MSVRITSTQLYQASQANIAASKVTLANLQEQASTGLRINKPSDDPVGAASMLRLNAAATTNTQYANNIADGITWLSQADSTLTSSESQLTSAIDDAVQGATGTATSTSRDALATDVESIRDSLLSAANTQVNGRSIFAGSSDASAAYTVTTASDGTKTYTYNGTAGSSVQRRISATQTVAVDADGSAAYGTGSTSVFATLDTLATALRSGDTSTIQSSMATLQTQLTSMTATHASVGVRYATLNTASTANSTQATSIASQLSSVSEIDSTSTYLALKTQEVTYQTALAVTAQTLQPTLMSYLQ